MARIPIYQSTAAIPGPTDRPSATGEGFGAGVGAALAQAGGVVQQTGEVVYQRQEQREISQLNAAFSKKQAELTNKLRTDLNAADPNDADFSKRFDDGVQQNMEELSGLATTRGARDYYTKQSAALSGHFSVQAQAGQTELAGIAAQNNYLESLNAATSTLTEDPSSLDFVIQHQDETLNAMVSSGSLSRAKAIELQTHSHNEAGKSAALGTIENNPRMGLEALQGGAFDKYVDGTTKAALIGHAKTAIKAEEVDARLAAEEARRAKKDAADSDMGGMLGQIAEPDPENRLTAKDVLNNQNMTHEDKEHFLRLLGVIGEGGNRKTDPQVMGDALHRAYLPADDPNRLTEEEIKQGAGTVYRDPAEINQLFTAVQQRKTAEGRQENDGFGALEAFAKKNLGGSAAGIPDPAGDALVADFMFKAKSKYDQERKAGKSVDQLLSATSPDFIGKYLQVPSLKERSMRYISAFKGGSTDLTTTTTFDADANLKVYTPEQAAKLPSGTRFKGTDNVARTKQ